MRAWAWAGTRSAHATREAREARVRGSARDIARGTRGTRHAYVADVPRAGFRPALRYRGGRIYVSEWRMTGDASGAVFALALQDGSARLYVSESGRRGGAPAASPHFIYMHRGQNRNRSKAYSEQICTICSKWYHLRLILYIWIGARIELPQTSQQLLDKR